MTETTFEEATRCPKCKQPGEVVSTKKVTDRDLKMGKATANTVMCHNPVCTWVNTNWVVQVNPDGSIPTTDYSKHENKRFPNRGAAVEQRVLDAVAKQLAQETQQGGGEIRR